MHYKRFIKLAAASQEYDTIESSNSGGKTSGVFVKEIIKEKAAIKYKYKR